MEASQFIGGQEMWSRNLSFCKHIVVVFSWSLTRTSHMLLLQCRGGFFVVVGFALIRGGREGKVFGDYSSCQG